MLQSLFTKVTHMVYKSYSHDLQKLLTWFTKVTHMVYKSYSHVLQKLLTWFTKVTHMVYKSYSHDIQKLLTWFTKVTHMVYKSYSHGIQKLLTWFSTRLSRDTIVIFSLSRSLPIIHAPGLPMVWSNLQPADTAYWTLVSTTSCYHIHCTWYQSNKLN